MISKINILFLDNRIKSILLLLSCLCIFALISPIEVGYIIISVILAFLTYICIVNLYSKINMVNIQKATILLLSIFISYIESSLFFERGIKSNKALMASRLLKIRLDFLLNIIRYLLMVLSLYAIFYILSIIVDIVLSIIKKVNVSLLLSYFTNHSFLEYVSHFIKSVLIVAFSSIVATSVLFFTYKYKGKEVDLNVSKSAYLIKDEGVSPSLFGYCQSQLDNFTDSIMLLEAGNDSNNSIINRAMLVYRDTLPNKNPYEVLIEKYIHNKQSFSTMTYSRYWHGYLSILIPLLSFMNYLDIRTANAITQTLFAIIFAALLYKKKLKHLIIPYVLSILMMCLPAIANCLQFSSCYYIMTIGSLIILISDDLNIKPNYIFLFIGICVAFFDFLTYPIATFGFPMIIYLSCNEEKKLEDKLFCLVKCGVFWLFGYGLMWFSKWVIASLTTDEKAISYAFKAFAYRTSNTSPEGHRHSVLYVIYNNVLAFFKTPFTIAVLIFILIIIVKIYKNESFDKIKKASLLYYFAPYGILAILPILWYCFATDHSAMHYWFTNKSLIVSLFSILVFLVNLEKKSNY